MAARLGEVTKKIRSELWKPEQAFPLCFLKATAHSLIALGCKAEMRSCRTLQLSIVWDIHMQDLHAEEMCLFPLVCTLTWDLRARTSRLLAEVFRTGTCGLIGGNGKLQYSLSLEPAKLIVKPLRG